MYLKHMGGGGYAQSEPFLPCIQWPCIWNLHDGFFYTGLGDSCCGFDLEMDHQGWMRCAGAVQLLGIHWMERRE